jgi:hypothetical protein
MTIVETLIGRNEEFAAHRYRAGLSMMPTLKTVVVACVDPRVDPAEVLGLRLGEAVVVRNIGGRITPATLQTMAMLGMIGRAEGGPPGSGWNLVVLHHTDCGMTRLLGTPNPLTDHFGISPGTARGQGRWRSAGGGRRRCRHPQGDRVPAGRVRRLGARLRCRDRPARPRRAAGAASQRGARGMSKPLVLVTGATGKTGAAVVAQLREKGWPVRAVVRLRDERSARLDRLGAETVVADLFDPDHLLDALRGCPGPTTARPSTPT